MKCHRRDAQHRQTLLEACALAGLRAPRTHEDLVRVYRVLHAKGIGHNMVEEPTWWDAMEQTDREGR